MNAIGPRQPYWLPLLVAASLALLTYWLSNLGHLPLRLDMSGFNHDPDYIVEHFQATAFDMAGAPRYRLAAVKMIHYMDDDTTQLVQPRFTREDPGRPSLSAVSDRGQVSSNGDHVHLLGHVRLERTGQRQAPLTLDTQYLHIVPDADIVQTDKQVTIRQQGALLTAGSMVLDGSKRTLVLTDRVKGTYETRR